MIARLSSRPNPLLSAGLGSQPRRWNSWSRDALTTDALRAKVEAGIKDSHSCTGVALHAGSGTVSTAAGDLPISPLFDPCWIKARRRPRKLGPGKPTGRFRKKLAMNPYGNGRLSRASRPRG